MKTNNFLLTFLLAIAFTMNACGGEDQETAINKSDPTETQTEAIQNCNGGDTKSARVVIVVIDHSTVELSKDRIKSIIEKGALPQIMDSSDRLLIYRVDSQTEDGQELGALCMFGIASVSRTQEAMKEQGDIEIEDSIKARKDQINAKHTQWLEKTIEICMKKPSNKGATHILASLCLIQRTLDLKAYTPSNITLIFISDMLEESHRHFETTPPSNVTEAKKWALEDLNSQTEDKGLEANLFKGMKVLYKLPNGGEQKNMEKAIWYWKALFEQMGAYFSELSL